MNSIIRNDTYLYKTDRHINLIAFVTEINIAISSREFSWGPTLETRC